MKRLLFVLFLGLTSNLFSQPAGYGFGKQILIQSSQVSGLLDLLNFPMLVSFTDPDLRTTVNGGNVENASGFDIIFTEGDCSTLLNHQIEKYDPVTGEYIAWVRIPVLLATSDKGIHMYYGNSAIAADPSSTATWDANYIGVWHMSEDPSGGAPQITDWTAGTSNGTSNGGMTGADLVTAKIGDGIDFDGSNDYIGVGDVLIDGLTQITVEAWIRPTVLPVKASPSGHNSNEGAIIHKNGASDDNLGITVATGGTAFYIDDGSNNTPVAPAVVVDAWTFVVGTWNNATMTIYQDGTSAATLGGVNGTFVNNNNELRFGGVHGTAGGNPHEFTGIIDEIKISNIARSADWVATEFNNQNSPSTFYNVSVELTAAVLCATLPIELLDFSAELTSIKSVQLNWQTASETDNDYFTVERSKNGTDWTSSIKVDGAGSSTTKLYYKTVDNSPYFGTSYYRLKQTDYDGQYSYSAIESVNISELSNEISIYPNPTTNDIIVRGSSVELEKIQVFDILGQDVTKMTSILKISDTEMIIDLSELSASFYFILTQTTSNKVYKQ
jgi:biopolymer transport protein ExbB